MLWLPCHSDASAEDPDDYLFATRPHPVPRGPPNTCNQGHLTVVAVGPRRSGGARPVNSAHACSCEVALLARLSRNHPIRIVPRLDPRIGDATIRAHDLPQILPALQYAIRCTAAARSCHPLVSAETKGWQDRAAAHYAPLRITPF